MSVDLQAGLHNVDRAREIDSDYLEAKRNQATGDEARYRSPITTPKAEAGEDLATSKHECENCGHTVTPTYHRGNSDNAGTLHHCKWCPSVNQTDMKNGAGAKPDYSARISDHHTRTGGDL